MQSFVEMLRSYDCAPSRADVNDYRLSAHEKYRRRRISFWCIQHSEYCKLVYGHCSYRHPFNKVRLPSTLCPHCASLPQLTLVPFRSFTVSLKSVKVLTFTSGVQYLQLMPSATLCPQIWINTAHQISIYAYKHNAQDVINTDISIVHGYV